MPESNRETWWAGYHNLGDALQAMELVVYIRINGTVNREFYTKILKYCAIPSLTNYFGNNETVFQQDYALSHTAGILKSCSRVKISIF